MATRKLVRKPSTPKSTSSNQVGLNQSQVSQLKGMKGIDQKALSAYESSGSVVGGKNNPNGRGRETATLKTDQLGTTSPVVPAPPTPTDVGNMLGMNNASVLQEGLTLDGGQFVKDESASDVMNATKEANMNLGNIANQMIGYLKPEDNKLENAYQDTYGVSTKQAGRDFRGAQQEVQQYTSQLNNITASRDAAVLSLEGQGRGQTQGFIGGEQARINREAAIQALPVQAQLAAAQGNLEIAKSHVDSLFQMKVKDIETQQNYKNTVANTWMSVANAQQQNLLSAAIADSNARADMKKTAMNDAKQIAMQAIEYGQSSLASSVMKLDPNSKTYQQDVMQAMAGLRKPVAATAPKAPATQNVKRADGTEVTMQYNYETGRWEELSASSQSPTSTDATQKTLDQIAFLKTTIKDSTDLVGATGPNMISKGLGYFFVGNTEVKQLANKLDTLKTNLLTLNSDPALKKFFGPQMTEKDTQLLMSAGSTLNAYDSNEKDNKAELDRYSELLDRMETAIKKGQSATLPPVTQTGPDGVEYQIID